MSLATIRNPILRDLGLDSGSVLVNDAKQRILDYINEAIEELNIMADWEILKEEASVTLVTDTALYTLATNCDVNNIRENKFYIDSDDRVIKRVNKDSEFQELEIVGATGLPTVWVPWRSEASTQTHQIKVYPTPTSSENGKTMDYWYTRVLDELAVDSDTTPFQEVVIRHVVKAKYAEYDDDYAKRDREMASADRLLSKIQAQNRGVKRFVPKTRRNYNS